MATITMISRAKRASPGCLSASSPPTVTIPQRKRQRVEEVSPLMVLRSIFGNACLVNNSSPKSFLKPSEEEINAFDLDAVRAIRAGNLAELKRLHAEGKNLNASNQFGESLLHMACRRGNLAIVSYMLREAKVRVEIRDDFGRTALHDACWTSTPNFAVMDELLEFVDPFMLLTEDVRGSTPLDYARRNHWDDWVKYLMARREKIQEKVNHVKREPSLSMNK